MAASTRLPPPPPAPPLVATAHPSQLRRLEDFQQYVRVAQSGPWQVKPAIVHFGGYELHRQHRQTVHVVNASGTSQRLHVLPPSTPHFRLEMDKKGVVAPGMSQALTVVFEPHEWRYHYDCVRLHTGGEGNLLVPIHAYPVMNTVIFPRRLDMGYCPLAHTTRRTVQLACKVPIAFEFEVVVAREHPHFRVHPTRGVVPANGAVPVAIEYTPQAHGTATIELRVSVSQYNHEPVPCAVVACCPPTLIRQQALAQAAARLGMGASTGHEQGTEALDNGSEETPPAALLIPSVGSSHSNSRSPSHRGRAGQKQQQDPSQLLDHYDVVPPRSPHGPGSGAALDAGGQWLQAKRSQAFRQGRMDRMTSTQHLAAEVKHQELLDVEGLKVPLDMHPQTAVNFVLTQQPGKLKPKELKAAIEDTRRARAEQKQQQDTLMTTLMQAGGGPLPPGTLTADVMVAELLATGQSQSSRQLKELVFRQEVRLVEAAERDREFKASEECVGLKPFTEAQVRRVLRAREDLKHEQDRARREGDRSRKEALLLHPEAPQALRGRGEALLGRPPQHRPDFDVYKAADWRQRTATLRRLVYLVSKVIVRSRASRRLEAIKAWLGGVRTRAEVRAMVEEENKRAAEGGGGRSRPLIDWERLRREFPGDFGEALPPPFAVSPGRIRGPAFPMLREEEGGTEGPGGGGDWECKDLPTSFADEQLFQLLRPKEAAVMGYAELRLPGNVFYPPIEVDRPLRDGTEEPLPQHTEPKALKGSKP